MGQKGKPRRADGEGTLEWLPKEKRWRIRLTVRTPEGKARKAFTAKKQGDAIRKRDEYLKNSGGRQAAGVRRSIDPEKTTLAEYLPDWLRNAARGNNGASSFERYEQAVRLQLVPLLGAVTLAEINAGDVRYLKQTLLDEGLAPDTVAYVQGVLSTALNQAVSDRLIPENPSRLVKRAKSRRQKMRTLDQEQAQRLVAAVGDTPDRVFYLTAVRLGLRRGELLGLRWPDFDPGRRELSVRRAEMVRGGEERWALPKDGEERTIRLGPRLVTAFQEHRKLQAEARLAAASWEHPELVFTGKAGVVIRDSTLHDRFKKILRGAGLPDIRFHDLRHTAATLMLKNKVDVRTVAEILGHKDPAMTLRKYAHVLSDMQDDAASRMDAVLF